MLAAAAPHARWIDVFCDRGAFTGEQARAVLTAGIEAGLQPRIHANQLEAGPAFHLAFELGAASADHCPHLTRADVDALADGDTVATLLPGAEFATRSTYPDARGVIDAGVTVALATDCGPRPHPRLLLSPVDPVLHRARGAGDADAARRSAVGGHRRRRAGAAPRRH